MLFWIITLLIAVGVGYFFLAGGSKKSKVTKKIFDESNRKTIAIIGIGGIGSTLAYEFSKSGHDVTAIARGKRYEQLKKENAIVISKTRDRAQIKVAEKLDTSIPYDLVVVSVLAHQLDVLLPQLKESKAKTIVFSFNTFDNIYKIRDVVGADRFVWGFPSIMGRVEPDGSAVSEVMHSGQLSTFTDQKWADFFTENGITATVEPDIESWLKTHAVFMAPLQVAAALAYNRNGGISWNEADILSNTLKEDFDMVEKMGFKVIPNTPAKIRKFPNFVLNSILWAVVHIPAMKALGGTLGWSEVRSLYESVKRNYKGPLPYTDKVISWIPTHEHK